MEWEREREMEWVCMSIYRRNRGSGKIRGFFLSFLCSRKKPWGLNGPHSLIVSQIRKKMKFPHHVFASPLTTHKHLNAANIQRAHHLPTWSSFLLAYDYVRAAITLFGSEWASKHEEIQVSQNALILRSTMAYPLPLYVHMWSSLRYDCPECQNHLVSGCSLFRSIWASNTTKYLILLRYSIIG